MINNTTREEDVPMNNTTKKKIESASSRGDAPKNLIARTPEQVSQMQMAVPEACSPNSHYTTTPNSI